MWGLVYALFSTPRYSQHIQFRTELIPQSKLTEARLLLNRLSLIAFPVLLLPITAVEAFLLIIELEAVLANTCEFAVYDMLNDFLWRVIWYDARIVGSGMRKDSLSHRVLSLVMIKRFVWSIHQVAQFSRLLGLRMSPIRLGRWVLFIPLL